MVGFCNEFPYLLNTKARNGQSGKTLNKLLVKKNLPLVNSEYVLQFITVAHLGMTLILIRSLQC